MKWLRFLRSNKRSAPTAPDTARAASSPFVLDADMLSDVGCVRQNNEDAGRIFRDFNGNGSNRILVVVADGMGGHNAGEVASATAVTVIEAAYQGMHTQPAERLKRALENANAAIYEESSRAAETKGMGTTCTALLLQEGYAYSAHVGDSRIYLVRDNAIYVMTEDHSAVMQMVKMGDLSFQQARHHPDKNILIRCLGTQPVVEVSTWPQPLPVQVGDHFLLCSDGLYDQLEDDEICAILLPRSPAEACEELVRKAKERGGPDNITVAVVGLQPVAARPGSSAPVTRQAEVLQ
jgi:PPM family protein phosphatase